MALTVEQLAEIMIILESTAIKEELRAKQWRSEVGRSYLTPLAKEMREKAVLRCETNAAKMRGLVEAIKEELGHETDPA